MVQETRVQSQVQSYQRLYAVEAIEMGAFGSPLTKVAYFTY